MNDASLSVSSKKLKDNEFFALKTLCAGQDEYIVVPHPKYPTSETLGKGYIDLLRVQLLASTIQFKNSFYYYNRTLDLSGANANEEGFASDIASFILKGMDADFKGLKSDEENEDSEDENESEINFIARFRHPDIGIFYVHFCSAYGRVHSQNYFMIEEDDIPKVKYLISGVGECLYSSSEGEKLVEEEGNNKISHIEIRHQSLHTLKKRRSMESKLGITDEEFNGFDNDMKEIAVLTFLIDSISKTKAANIPSEIPHLQLFHLILKHRENSQCLSFVIMDVLANLHCNCNAYVVHCNTSCDSMQDHFVGKRSSPKINLQEAHAFSYSNIKNILKEGGELFTEIKEKKKVVQSRPATLESRCIMRGDKRKSDELSIEEDDSQTHAKKKQKSGGVILMHSFCCTYLSLTFSIFSGHRGW